MITIYDPISNSLHVIDKKDICRSQDLTDRVNIYTEDFVYECEKREDRLYWTNAVEWYSDIPF